MSRATRPPVYSVTGARRGTSDDLAQRQRRYLISMSIRTVAFVMAVVTHGPLRWIFVAAAVILPYIAVVMANAVGSRPEAGPTPYVAEQPALDAARHPVLEHPPYGAPPASPSAGRNGDSGAPGRAAS